MKRFFLFVFLLGFFQFSQAFGENILITSILPNTDDDATLEYIEITNFNSNSVSLSGYSLKDKIGKTYYFGESHILQANESKKFYRPETKILLNNTDEELWLYDSNLSQIDYFSYPTSTKNIIIQTGHTGTIILSGTGETEENEEFLTGETVINSGITDSGSLENTLEIQFLSTGSIVGITDSGATLSGISFTGGENINIYRGTGELNFSGSYNSGSFIFTDLNSDLEYFYKLELLDFSGQIADFFTGSFITLQKPKEPIIAQKLYYSDTDFNSKIDKLDIEFSRTLTGILNYDKFKIYSNTGGLATRLINSESGLIKDYLILDNILSISIIEQDNIKSELNITNTTSSDLRLKSLSGIGITDLDFNEIPTFSLTSSFSDYKNVFKKEQEINSDSGSISENTTSQLEENSNTGDIIESSGSVESSGSSNESGNNFSFLNSKIIPEINYSFQQPTYLLSFSGVIDEYICDKTKSECKINLNLENTFSTGFSESDYSCTIEYSTGEIVNSCNPTIFTFSSGTYFIKLKITDKDNISNYKQKIIIVHNEYETLEIPEPIITVQSGLDASNRCSKLDCIVNFSGDESFKILSNPKYSCLWDFTGGSYTSGTENNCNPGYIHYMPGNYVIKLKIFEAGNENNFKQTTFSFSNYVSFVSGMGTLDYNTNYAPVAIITPQGSIGGKSKKQDNKIIYCIGVEKCNVNFTGEQSYDLNSNTLNFYWDLGNGTFFEGKNPKSVDYLSGSYVIRLRVVDDKGLDSVDEFYVRFLENEEKVKGEKVKEDKTKLKSYKLKEKYLKEMSGSLIFDEEYLGDKLEFDEIFKKILQQIDNEIKFEKLFNSYSDEIKQEEKTILDYKISLQGNLSNNLFKNGDMIFCRGRKNCKVNLGLDGEKISGYKYFWDLGNGTFFEGKNPKQVTYDFGKYEINLSIFDESGELVFSKKLFANISPIPKKAKIQKQKSKKSKKTNESKKIIIKENSKKTFSQDFMTNISESNMYFTFLFIILFSLSGYNIVEKSKQIFTQK